MNSPVRSLGRRLRFSQLELVLEVAACGNLGEAAQRLHLTRAGVSKSIKELERSLGQVLFERSARGMRPTPAGVRVAKHAQLLVNELQHLTDEAAAAGGGGSGLLRIGLQPFVGEYVLPPILQRLRAAAGAQAQTIVQLHEGRLHSLIEQLLRGNSMRPWPCTRRARSTRSTCRCSTSGRSSKSRWWSWPLLRCGCPHAATHGQACGASRGCSHRPARTSADRSTRCSLRAAVGRRRPSSNRPRSPPTSNSRRPASGWRSSPASRRRAPSRKAGCRRWTSGRRCRRPPSP
ncbi:LysR family transcriptional regulator [Ramlibacter terrae]|uniref:LysR family transcriptional regulator n=1 Tax=Ramlibacter terrae TaxID=2732511 RepID=A0ABX6P3Y6_9BURK|nr:LysR family transcriptional regulator [Ramlibacter terrae]